MTSHFLTDVSCHPATRGHDLFNLAFEGVLEAWCFLMGFFSLDNIFVINAFHQRNHRGKHAFTSASRFPQCHCPWLYQSCSFMLRPKLTQFESWSVKKTLAEIFSHMARNTLLTVLCFASAFGDLHESIVESDIDDPSGTSEVIEPSFWMVFGDRNGRRMRNDENRLTSNQ